jgi:hypothetical protein
VKLYGESYGEQKVNCAESSKVHKRESEMRREGGLAGMSSEGLLMCEKSKVKRTMITSNRPPINSFNSYIKIPAELSRKDRQEINHNFLL